MRSCQLVPVARAARRILIDVLRVPTLTGFSVAQSGIGNSNAVSTRQADRHLRGDDSDSYADTPLYAEPAMRFTSNMVTSSSLNFGSTSDSRFAIVRPAKLNSFGKKRRIRQPQTELSKKSLELGVFGLGLFEDGDIGVGVFP
jgi:hypothetical protein